MDSQVLRGKLLTAIVAYDKRQSKRTHYNRYALSHYCDGLGRIMADIDAGATPRQAILASFTGTLASAALRAIGEPKPTAVELRSQSIVYTPFEAAR